VVVRQPTLFGGGEPAVVDVGFTRVDLDACSWIEVARGWLAGADTLFDRLVATVPWRQGRRSMYERMVDDPRLSHWYGDADLPDPALVAAQRRLEDRYGVRFGGVGLNLYRDGADSVAYHRDRDLREASTSLVAILTLGERRPFLVRPRGGGRSVDLAPAGGDLLVMGGACQRDWEHGVPKRRHAGPRLSCSWRWSERGPAGPVVEVEHE
jgi:alkylated DNA repair dioxygenase AlkB